MALSASAVRALSGSAALIAVTLAVTPISAWADAKISGNPEAVSVDAQNSTIEEILTALGREFNVHVTSTANLTKQMTGTYEGSLRHVLARILNGYNTVVKSNAGQLEVTVFGTDKAPAAVPNQVAAQQQPQQPKMELTQGPIPMPGGQVATPAVAAAPAVVADRPEPPTVGKAVAPTPIPEIKIAEGPVPMPSPAKSYLAPPVVDQKTAVMPPMPTASGAGTVPELQPAASPPPMMPVPGSAPGNGPSPAPTDNAAPATPAAHTSNPS